MHLSSQNHHGLSYDLLELQNQEYLLRQYQARVWTVYKAKVYARWSTMRLQRESSPYE
ncbi:uncharacterized protein STEHIDRAFT_120192 [Stereum hirsutum FP-91666 SS1]|uniref:uncharacterized protein n=1 Tax=Stereum hirsutum (strain FP-91666) TaxID=721885 RepID=UPI000440B6B5|nr:uncharacterized protein STEHIDRAFT_120192 [Stereum hirsutum FP-91666 SS1]EIM87956.1 hypothetical protein STEHIDRAFT_120192 [Stereum hirsutum FP-91666 SS1]